MLDFIQEQSKILHMISGVYLIQGETTKLVKIGYSEDIPKRLQTLKSSSPDKLTLLGYLQGAGTQAELKLHKKFEKWRVHHEWFQADPSILDYFSTNNLFSEVLVHSDKQYSSQLERLIAQEGMLNLDGLGTRVVISDIKRAYGCTRFLVTAKDGDGSKIWVDSDRVVLA